MKADDFIAVMESFVGITETPPGSNRTVIGQEFGWNGVAWCAETVSVASHRLGFPLKEAAVSRIAQHARAGDYGLKWTRTPVRAAIVCYDFGGRGNPNDMHTGVVRNVLADGRFYAIEGNHRDRCEVVLRDMKFVMGFAVPPFDDSEAPSPLPQPSQPQSAPTQEDSDLVANLATLQRGSTGQLVKNLQGLLCAAGRNVAIDADFGSATEAALKDWQAAANVPGGADGVCGTNTWRYLLGLH